MGSIMVLIDGSNLLLKRGFKSEQNFLTGYQQNKAKNKQKKNKTNSWKLLTFILEF